MPVFLVLCIDIEVVENAAGYGVGVTAKMHRITAKIDIWYMHRRTAKIEIKHETTYLLTLIPHKEIFPDKTRRTGLYVV